MNADSTLSAKVTAAISGTGNDEITLTANTAGDSFTTTLTAADTYDDGDVDNAAATGTVAASWITRTLAP